MPASALKPGQQRLDQWCDIDEWAVRVVVRERRFMDLRVGERCLAAHMLRDLGMMPSETAELLRVHSRVVQRYLLYPRPSCDSGVTDYGYEGNRCLNQDLQAAEA